MESFGEKLVGMFESIKMFMIKQDEINVKNQKIISELIEKNTDLECKINVLKEALYRLQIKEDVGGCN